MERVPLRHSLLAIDMIPLLRWNEFHDGRHSVAYKCLEPSRAPIKPVEHYGAICPCINMEERNFKDLTHMVKQMSQ